MMISNPVSRRLRVLAFDPSLTTQVETSMINQLTLRIPWEPLEPGPVGEYLEVVDYDPASGVFYSEVDLNDPNVLAQDGLAPSESDPRFHQQMVYAVAMSTIRNFERALGRLAFWGDRAEPIGGKFVDQFVRRLRIYPHALRERNAYYSPSKKAILFGYFPVRTKDKDNTPGTVVFTCLSHDIIVHEVTHALLDGVHPRFNEPTNPDVHAFHEAFADLVALFQHFSHRSVLENQIRRARGDLNTESLLSQLAQEFGRATGRGAALRDALGTGEGTAWQPTKPDSRALESTTEPHERGGILVAAVFRAFLLIYRYESADLFRIATQGTGVLVEGEIHPDLTRRLAREAASAADRVLQMCIRAIDFSPPVDMTFGDFLRAVITADLDIDPENDAYRIAFIQCFKEWGIHPRGITSMSLDALTWPSARALLLDRDARSRKMGNAEHNAELASRRDHIRSSLLNLGEDEQPFNFESDRFALWQALRRIRKRVSNWLLAGDSFEGDPEIFGLIVDDSLAKPTVYRRQKDGVVRPSIEVHAVRPTVRPSLYGGARTDLVVEVTQRRRAYFDTDVQEAMDARDGNGAPRRRFKRHDFIYRAGCTLIIDLATQDVRRVIRTSGTVNDDDALERVRAYRSGDAGGMGNAFDAGMGTRHRAGRNELFALLHEQGDV